MGCPEESEVGRSRTAKNLSEQLAETCTKPGAETLRTCVLLDECSKSSQPDDIYDNTKDCQELQTKMQKIAGKERMTLAGMHTWVTDLETSAAIRRSFYL